MGVTLGRAIIKGGTITAAETPFDLGPSLAPKVDVFIGLAGANYGLVNCWMNTFFPTCNGKNGFYPGSYDATDLSTYLKNLNSNNIKEGAHVFTMLST